jgi:hypothetical protein
MNKVIVTGLALSGSDNSEGICQVCNYDYSWIFDHPSVILWADKIILTDYIKSVINECQYPEKNKPLSKAIKMLFDILETYGQIDIKNLSDVLTPLNINQISTQVENDRLLLSRNFPEVVQLGNEQEVPGQLFIDKTEYCQAKIHSIYTGLLLARAWDASCLFTEYDHNYLKYRLGIDNVPKKSSAGYLDTFNSIFSTYLPNLELIPHYAYGSQCKDCKKEKSCSDNFLNDLEKNALELISWRNYDEIIQIKKIIDKSIKRYENASDIDPVEIKNYIREKKIKMNKLLNKTFPKIKRWSNLVAITSVPFAVAGLAANNSLLTITGASFVGGAEIVSNLTSLLESKLRWTGFLNK